MDLLWINRHSYIIFLWNADSWSHRSLFSSMIRLHVVLRGPCIVFIHDTSTETPGFTLEDRTISTRIHFQDHLFNFIFSFDGQFFMPVLGVDQVLVVTIPSLFFDGISVCVVDPFGQCTITLILVVTPITLQELLPSIHLMFQFTDQDVLA